MLRPFMIKISVCCALFFPSNYTKTQPSQPNKRGPLTLFSLYMQVYVLLAVVMDIYGFIINPIETLVLRLLIAHCAA